MGSDSEQDEAVGLRIGSRTSQPQTPELDSTLVSEPAPNNPNLEATSAELLVKRRLLEVDSCVYI